MGKTKPAGAIAMNTPKVDTAPQSPVFKAPPRRHRIVRPPTPPPAPARAEKSGSDDSDR